MMITKMMKISLFVLAAMISGGSAYDDCGTRFTNKHDCNDFTNFLIFHPCRWDEEANKCVSSYGPIRLATEATASSFVSMEAGVVGDHLDQEDDVGDKNDNDASSPSDSELDLEDEPNANVSDKRSYLRTN